MKQHKKWKLMFLTWIILYPLLNITTFILNPYIDDWNPLLKTLLITIILIPIMSIILGILHKKYSSWLSE